MPPPVRSTVRFYLVDVFATRPLTGNPLALVPDADELTESQMRAIAREFNQSETTFLVRPARPDATWRLRSFTPIGTEVLGAGHNALGAWLWLAKSSRLPDGQGDFAQQIGDVVLPVRVSHDQEGEVVVSMEQSPPWFGAHVTQRSELAAAIGLTESELATDMPTQVVGTDVGHLLVAIGDRAAVDRARPRPADLAAVVSGVGGEGCYLYSVQPADDDANAYTRFFNPTVGIAEDPATGTAAGPLAALLNHLGPGSDRTVVIEQGHALGRPSRILVRVSGPRVTLSGSGLVVAEGNLQL
jgi:trans-2,3-dihydro-3-hydroxyanthranilate isomerase